MGCGLYMAYIYIYIYVLGQPYLNRRKLRRSSFSHDIENEEVKHENDALDE
jgi:hypothetical protein